MLQTDIQEHPIVQQPMLQCVTTDQTFPIYSKWKDESACDA